MADTEIVILDGVVFNDTEGGDEIVGDGGIGQVSVDTRIVADILIEGAKAVGSDIECRMLGTEEVI